MRILVTGASGFVGRVTCRYLAEHGHQVTGMARSEIDIDGVETVRGGFTIGALAGLSLRDAPFDAIVHLAAASTVRESFADPLGYFEANTVSTQRLLTLARDRGVPMPFILASTSAVYGDRGGALAEDMPPAPGSPYATSKLAAEDLVRWAARAGMIGGMVLRLFNVSGAAYGVVDTSPTRITGNAVRAAAGLIPHVSVNGDGSVLREFTHVLDVSAAILLAIERTELGQAETVNIGTGVGVSVADVIAAAGDVSGRPVPVEYRPTANESAALVSNPARAGTVLGWKPTRSSLERIVSDVWAHRKLLG